MAITDLTGYTWIGNNNLIVPFTISTAYIVHDWKHFYTGQKHGEYITFVNERFGNDMDSHDGSDRSTISSTMMDTTNWYAEDKTINITGGADATNPEVIAWFEQNGTLVKPVITKSVSIIYNSTEIFSGDFELPVDISYNGSIIATLGGAEEITDLTGYTWVGNDVLNEGNFSESYHLNFFDPEYGDQLDFFSVAARTPPIQVDYGLWDEGSYRAYDSSNGGWQFPKANSIQFTGGADATNTTLIAWLQANGTLTKSGGGAKTSALVKCASKFMRSNLLVGNKTLKCKGKTMSGDVLVQFAQSPWEPPVQEGSTLRVTQAFITQNNETLILE